MVPQPVKFAILSTANIANLVVDAINALPESECAAVASRDVKKARGFADKHGIPTACTYEDLLTLPVDAVYIPLPTSMKTDWAIRLAKTGKHVLVDKPLASAKSARAIMDACVEAGVAFLDGTHFVHSTRTKEVQRRIADGAVGTLRRVDASFCYPIAGMSENIRRDPTLEPLGFLGDLGWYCARAAVTYLGVESTSRILSASCTATFHPRFPGCVQRAAGVVEFGWPDRKVLLCFSCDSACAMHQRVAVVGECGVIETTGFVTPPNQSLYLEDSRPPHMRSNDLEYTLERSVSHVEGEDGYELIFPKKESVVLRAAGDLCQAELMIREFCRLILENDMTSAKQWAMETYITQTIVDELMSKVKE